MPIYLVRWSNAVPSICLVKAKNESELLAIMDEFGDPSYCRVQEYKGPLCIPLDLKLKSHEEAINVNDNMSDYHTIIDDVSELTQAPHFQFSGSIGTSERMEEEIIDITFPHYSAYLEKYAYKENENETECKKAIQADFDYFDKYIRRQVDREGGDTHE